MPSISMAGQQKARLKNTRTRAARLAVGTVTKYMKRYSFFKLYVRALGEINWIDITGDQPFAVRGVSPTNQYNTIHIEHPDAAASIQEYRLAPVPGFKYYKKLLDGGTQTIKLFSGSELYASKTSYLDSSVGRYKVSYTGSTFVLTADLAANPEWYFNESKKADFTPSGPILALESYGINYVPTVADDPKLLEAPAFIGVQAVTKLVCSKRITQIASDIFGREQRKTKLLAIHNTD